MSNSSMAQEDAGDLYVLSCGAPNLYTVAAGKTREEAFEKARRPGWPVYRCTLAEMEARIKELQAIFMPDVPFVAERVGAAGRSAES